MVRFASQRSGRILADLLGLFASQEATLFSDAVLPPETAPVGGIPAPVVGSNHPSQIGGDPAP
jgi:hypothetical protein